MDNVYPTGNTHYTTDDSSMAIISLIAGILGWTLAPFIGALVAVITGHMAKKEIRQSGGSLGGDGLATIGLVLGYSSLALSVCMCCFVTVVYLALLGSFITAGELESLFGLFLALA